MRWWARRNAPLPTLRILRILRCFAGVRIDVLRLILPVVPICRIPTGIAFFPKSERSFAHPVSTRGAFRDRHERRTRDAMDAIDHETNDLSRTAKSRGPGAPMLALSPQRCFRILRVTVARKPGHRGDRV